MSRTVLTLPRRVRQPWRAVGSEPRLRAIQAIQARCAELGVELEVVAPVAAFKMPSGEIKQVHWQYHGKQHQEAGGEMVWVWYAS